MKENFTKFDVILSLLLVCLIFTYAYLYLKLYFSNSLDDVKKIAEIRNKVVTDFYPVIDKAVIKIKDRKVILKIYKTYKDRVLYYVEENK